MPVYLVTPLKSNFDQIGASIKAHLPMEDSYEIQGRAGYLVSYKGTSVELSNLIGITSADSETKSVLGPAMVTSIGSYFGLASTQMWEWLRTRFEA